MNTISIGMMEFSSLVGGDSLPENKKCVPFVSEYSDCNDDNSCSGCTKCTCTSEGQWSCQDVKECAHDMPLEETLQADDEIFDNALNLLEFELDKKKLYESRQSKPNRGKAPSPQATKQRNALIGASDVKEFKMEDVLAVLLRQKRSTSNKNSKHKKRSVEKTSNKRVKNMISNNNITIKFYDTIDELNEDTLNNTNLSGTLPAKKMDMIPQLSMRRSGDGENISKALQIEYNQPKAYNQINDNKIDIAEHEIKFDASHESLKIILGNHSQIIKDKDLSKIVVNELKNGSEIIGDTSAPVTSNITFTPENDTLTAMAFIAGNLLNKLWNMEKDASGSSMETDAMKQEKISDLLDLFKEPLNLRQETFLKNALEQLSSAIDKDKDVKNISICENIEEVKKLLFNTSTNDGNKLKAVTKAPSNKNEVKVEENKQKVATVKAIKKINNVLDLIRKFETIQGNLSNLKHGPKLNFNNNSTSSNIRKLVIDTILTTEEKTSLNIFGSLLEKITKLLMPNRNNKKIVKQIKSLNVMGDHDNLKKKFKKLYNIDITNMTVSAKDRLILDYLTHIDRNPDCLLSDNKPKVPEALPSIEGNILLNLSEFFKMKSFSDLIKLLDQEKALTPIVTTTPVVDTSTELEKKKISTKLHMDSNKLNSTKEKLKAHLKTIIEDLIELQNAKGVSVKGNIKIADALPCIYNILNTGKKEVVDKNEDEADPVKKTTTIFSGLRKEIKAAKTRRNYKNTLEERPKSAAIWERIIKNLNNKSNLKNRRTINYNGPKSYDEIKKLIDRVENSSSTYKRYALLGQVPASGKLMMLKALELDVKTSIDVLEHIKLSFDNLSKLPLDKIKQLNEFVNNVATSMSVNDKVNEKLKQEPKKYFVDEINSSNKMLKMNLKKKPDLMYNELQDSNVIRVSRTQVLNQLIRNRVQQYLQTKKHEEFDANNDMSYNIAKRVLYYLDAENYELAHEMFKIFLMQKHDNLTFSFSDDHINEKHISTSTPAINESPMRRMASQQKEPLMQYEDPNRLHKQINWVNQDHLIKQLLNIKNMGM